MTQSSCLRKARGLTAAVVGTLFLFTTVATPLVEANFWDQRRDASRRINGKAQGAPTLLAQLPGSMGSMDGVLPPVNGALGSGLQSVPSADLSGVPTASDLRASALPSWLRGLPNSAGEIRDVALAKNAETAPVVVLVQDVHNVFSAQKNIAQIVSHIETAAARDHRGPVLIGLEGGVGAFDIKRFRAFRESKGHRLASELLLKTNFISGPEYYAFLSEREPLLWGIETPADYIENAEAVRASQPATERVTAALSAAQRAVEEKGEAVFSKELKDLNRTLAAHSNGTATIVDLVRVLRERAPKTSAPEVDKLQKALAMESTLDFSRVERERSALIESLVRTLDKPSIDRLVSASLNYRAGLISFGAYHAQLKALVKGHGIRWSDYAAFDRYVQYVLLAESIDKFRLFDEIEDLKTRAVASASRTPEEKAVMDLAEDLRLAGRLVHHEFGPAEWSNYATRKEPLAHLQPRLAEVLGANVVPGPSNEDLALFERFYVAADRRNDSLAANLLVKAKETDAKIMMLVAGGFHTPALSSRLKAKGLSVVTITPAMGEIPKGPNYLDIFLVKNIPIEQFLQGEKLYFSPPRVNAGGESLLPGSPITPTAQDRIAVAAEVAGGDTHVRSSVESQFPEVKISIGNSHGGVLVTAKTPSDGKESKVYSWTQGEKNDQVPAGVVVTGDGMNLALATSMGGTGKKGMGQGGALLLPDGARIRAALIKFSGPIARTVGFVFQETLSALTSVGKFFQGFQGGRSFADILNDWFSILVGPFKMQIVPEGETFSAPLLKDEDFEQLKSEVLDPNNLYFDLSALASSYGVSVDSLSSLLRKLGQEKSLRLPDGGWTSLLTISRPNGAKGAGPFVSRFQDVHKHGFLHDSVVVLAVTPDGRLVLQHRTDNNKFDVGASGHVDIGESPLQAASHELGEELGIDYRSANFIERLVPIPNPERPSGTFSKEGGKSFSEFLYRDSFDFFGPSKETNNKENVHLFSILLTPEEVSQIERMGTKKIGMEMAGAGFLPLQIIADVQTRMAEAAALVARIWLPAVPRHTTRVTVSGQEVDRVEIIDPLDLVKLVGEDGSGFASSLRHFFQGEKIRGVVTGYLRGLLAAEKLDQNLAQIARGEKRTQENVFGMTLVVGRPFPENGILRDVVLALRKGLVTISNEKIPNLGEKAYATLAPLVRSKNTAVSAEDLGAVNLTELLAALEETSPLSFELEEVIFGDLHDGSVILTLRETSNDALLELRKRLERAGLPFKFLPSQTGNRMYVQLATIGTKSFAKMTDEEIFAVRQWMEQHRDLKAWWDLHRRFLVEKGKNKPGFSDKQWLENELGHPVDSLSLSVWREEAEQLVGKPLVEPTEVVDHVLVATYNNRKLSGLVSNGVTIKLGEKSEEFPDAISLIEQVSAVKAGWDYHQGKLKTDPVGQEFRPSRKEDVPYLPDLPQEERDRLARIGLHHITNGTFAVLAAGSASRMASGLPSKVIDLLKIMWKSANPPQPRSKAAVPIAIVDGSVITFIGSPLTNINAFFGRLRSKGIIKPPSVLIYSNGEYIDELEKELTYRRNYALERNQIDTDLLQKLRPQFGGSVDDVMRMKMEGKFKSNEIYLAALQKARLLEEKLARGEGEAALLVTEKAPHGHGEFLHDFVRSGKLAQMIENGKEWLFVRNVDNVGAKVDYNFLVTLGLFMEKGLDFQGEVSPRLPGMKGGALIVTKEGQTILTEGPSFGATWNVVEKDLVDREFTALDEKSGQEYIESVFRKGEKVELTPTRMDFEGGFLEDLEKALQSLKDDEIRIYQNSEGETLTVRHVVPESTYWFNNATGLFSPRFFYFVYRRDENQTYDEFVDEMRKAYAQNHGGLQAIAQRGKDRFPILLDAKPTKSGGVGQKPETNAWQSTQVAGAAGAKIWAVGVDSLRTAGSNLSGLRFLATKQWEGPIESYESNFPLYPEVIQSGWVGERLIPDRLFKSPEESIRADGASSKQEGFLKTSVFMENSLARNILVGLILLLVSPLALAAPEVVLGSGTVDAVLAFLAAFGLVGRLYVKSNRARSGLLVLAVVSVMFLFSMPTFAAGPGVALAFGVMGAMKGVSQDQTLFEKTGRQSLGEELIPGVEKQFADLRMTTLELDRMMRGGPGEGINNLKTIGEMSRGEFPLYGIGGVNLPEYAEGREDERLSGAIDLLKQSRGNLLQEPGVLSGAAMDLTNALGFSAPRTAGPVFADHSVRAALLSGLAAGKDKGSQDFERVVTAVIETLGAFSERLFVTDQGLKMKDTLARLSALAKEKNGDVVVVDQIQPGVVKAVYLDETADPKMIENVMELVGRYLAPVGTEVLKKNGTTGNDITGVVVTLAPGLADGPQGKLIKRLLQMQDQVGERPVRIHQAEKSDDFVQETAEGYSVHLAKLLGLLNINSNLPGLRIQCIAPPTSTVVFDGSGLSNDVLVERIRWLLEGIGLRVSTDDAEREIRSLMATLKAA